MELFWMIVIVHGAFLQILEIVNCFQLTDCVLSQLYAFREAAQK